MVAQKSSKITLHFRCLYLKKIPKKSESWIHQLKALPQPLTLTIQDDTLSSLLISVSSEVSFFLTLFAICHFHSTRHCFSTSAVCCSCYRIPWELLFSAEGCQCFPHWGRFNKRSTGKHTQITFNFISSHKMMVKKKGALVLGIEV